MTVLEFWVKIFWMNTYQGWIVGLPVFLVISESRNAIDTDDWCLAFDVLRRTRFLHHFLLGGVVAAHVEYRPPSSSLFHGSDQTMELARIWSRYEQRGTINVDRLALLCVNTCDRNCEMDGCLFSVDLPFRTDIFCMIYTADPVTHSKLGF